MIDGGRLSSLEAFNGQTGRCQMAYAVRRDTWRRAILALCAVMLLITGLRASGVPQQALKRGILLLEESEAPFQADAVVIMLGGRKPERVAKAAELFHAGYAPLVVFGSGYYSSDWTQYFEHHYDWVSSTKTYQRRLEMAGVPGDRMLVVPTPNAYDTASEIKDLSGTLKARNMKRVLLVSNTTHTRRLGIIWKRINPDIEARTIGAKDPRVRGWWQSKFGIRTVGREYLGFVKEFLRQIANMADQKI